MPHDEWRTNTRGRSQAQNRRFGGLTGFKPSNLSGLVLWLRSDRGITIATGVSSWADQSGNGNTPTQGTPSAQPTLNATGGPTGGPALTFVAASSQCLNLASCPFASNLSVTLFMVLKFTSVAVTNIAYNAGGAIAFAGLATPARDFLAQGVADQTDTTSGATTNWEKWTGTVAAGPLWSLRVNGAAHTLSVNNSAPRAFSAQMNVGTDGAGTFANMSVAEIIGYNGVKSAADIATVEAYLLARYGI